MSDQPPKPRFVAPLGFKPKAEDKPRLEAAAAKPRGASKRKAKAKAQSESATEAPPPPPIKTPSEVIAPLGFGPAARSAGTAVGNASRLVKFIPHALLSVALLVVVLRLFAVMGAEPPTDMVPMAGGPAGMEFRVAATDIPRRSDGEAATWGSVFDLWEIANSSIPGSVERSLNLPAGADAEGYANTPIGHRAEGVVIKLD